MGADHERLADFLKLPPFMAATTRLQAHFVKYALTPALGGLSEFDHGAIMALLASTVNCPFGQVFRPDTLIAVRSSPKLVRHSPWPYNEVSGNGIQSLLQIHSAAVNSRKFTNRLLMKANGCARGPK